MSFGTAKQKAKKFPKRVKLRTPFKSKSQNFCSSNKLEINFPKQYEEYIHSNKKISKKPFDIKFVDYMEKIEIIYKKEYKFCEVV